MNRDVVPYQPTEAFDLGKGLAHLGVGAPSPATALDLLRHVNAVRELIKTRKDLTKDMVDVLEGYVDRILDVCNVLAGAQKEVIDQLERLGRG